MLNRNKNQSGFTLIELMIAVAVIGILVALAVPSYSSYMDGARRTDAVVMLLEVSGEQERFYSENNSYAANMAALGYGTGTANSFASPDGHYNISVSAQTANTFTLTATPVTGGSQDGDACGNFSFSNTGAKSVSTGTAADCWK